MTSSYDFVLVGGGLQSALLALALRARQPQSRIALVEREARFGGNHTWCFHASDVEPESRDWLAPLVSKRWPAYAVRFKNTERRIEREYTAITSARLHEILVNLCDARTEPAFLQCEVTEVHEDHVTLADGRQLGRSRGD